MDKLGRLDEFTKIARASLSSGSLALSDELCDWIDSNALLLDDPWVAALIAKLGTPPVQGRARTARQRSIDERFEARHSQPDPAVEKARLTGSLAERQAAQRLLDDKVLLATHRSSERLLDAALAQGGDIDAKDNSGSTPLMLATMTRDARFVQILLDRGARLDPRAPGGATAVEIARSLLLVNHSRNPDHARALADIVGLLEATVVARAVASAMEPPPGPRKNAPRSRAARL